MKISAIGTQSVKNTQNNQPSFGSIIPDALNSPPPVNNTGLSGTAIVFIRLGGLVLAVSALALFLYLKH